MQPIPLECFWTFVICLVFGVFVGVMTGLIVGFREGKRDDERLAK